jgi:hypothetical protein
MHLFLLFLSVGFEIRGAVRLPEKLDLVLFLLNSATVHIFLDDVETTIFNSVQEGSNHNAWVPQSQSLYLAQGEINFVADLEHRGKVKKVIFCLLPRPVCVVHETLDELFFPCEQVHHSAVVVPH